MNYLNAFVFAVFFVFSSTCSEASDNNIDKWGFTQSEYNSLTDLEMYEKIKTSKISLSELRSSCSDASSDLNACVLYANAATFGSLSSFEKGFIEQRILFASQNNNPRAMAYHALLILKSVEGKTDLKWTDRGFQPIPSPDRIKPEINAKDILKKSASLGNSIALIELAKLEINKMPPNLNQASELLNNAIEIGNTDALVLMGNYYIKGDVFEKNFQSAKFLLEKAIKKGRTDAMVILADGLLAELGKNGGYKPSSDLYREASKKGNIIAMRKYAWALNFGIGVIQDKKSSRFWINKSAEGGDFIASSCVEQDEYNEKFAKRKTFCGIDN